MGGGGGGVVGAGEVKPLPRAKRLHQQSIMSFWLILKKKNDLQAKAARVQELRAMLEKIRCERGGKGAYIPEHRYLVLPCDLTVVRAS